MCLVSSLGIFNLLSSLLEEKVVDLEGLSLRERNFGLRESLGKRALGGRFYGLGRRVNKSLKMRGVGVYL